MAAVQKSDLVRGSSKKGKDKMQNEEKEKLKMNICARLNEIYNECGRDYEKYVLTIEQMEKEGKIKSEYIGRDNTQNIFNS